MKIGLDLYPTNDKPNNYIMNMPAHQRNITNSTAKNVNY